MGGSKPTRKPLSLSHSSSSSSPSSPSSFEQSKHSPQPPTLADFVDLASKSNERGSHASKKSRNANMKDDLQLGAADSNARSSSTPMEAIPNLNHEMPNILKGTNEGGINSSKEDSLARLRADILKLKKTSYYPKDNNQATLGNNQSVDVVQKQSDLSPLSSSFVQELAGVSSLEQAQKDHKKQLLNLPKEVTRSKSLSALSLSTFLSQPTLGQQKEESLDPTKASNAALNHSIPEPPQAPKQTTLSAPSSPCLISSLATIKPPHISLGPFRSAIPNMPKTTPTKPSQPSSTPTKPSYPIQPVSKTSSSSTWAELVKGNRRPTKCNALEFKEAKGSPKVDVILPKEVIRPPHSHCLVGYFNGKRPGTRAVHKLVASWKVKVQLKFHASGWVVFQFDNQEEMQKVLSEGPHI